MKLLRRVFYLLSITGLVLVNFTAQPAFGADLTDLKDQLSDARPTTVANHTFTIDQAVADALSDNGGAANDTITIDFVDGDGWDTSALASTDALDYDIVENGNDRVLVDSATACTGDTIQVTTVNTTTDTITFTVCDGYTEEVTAGTDIVIEIGLNATVGGNGNSQIINSTSVGVKQVNVDTLDAAAKDTAVVLVAGVDVSATIDETITITVNGIAAAACTDNGGTPTEPASSTATTIPFGTIAANTGYSICQRVDIETNASVGYNAYVSQSQLLTSGVNTIAEGDCDGAGPACSDTTPGPWETVTAGNEGFGFCADDIAQNAAADAGIAAADQCDDATPFFTTFFLITQLNTFDFMASTVAVSGDQTNLSYHLVVSGTQAAGTYTNVMTYVAVGTF